MDEDFCFLVFTNENYLPIADLTIGEFDKFFPENKIKKYIVSNRFLDYEFENNKDIFIDCNIGFDGSGRHFAECMLHALKFIKEEYIIFFCDDYMFIDKPNTDRLYELLGKIKSEKIDFFSFASMLPNSSWNKVNLQFKDLEERQFYEIPNDYFYLYSAQPCIWKKSSLLEILKYNQNISLHDLDTNKLRNREGFTHERNYETGGYYPYEQGSQNYGFKCICTDYKAYDELDNYEFFIFPYIEIIRGGFFNIQVETNTKRFFLEKFIKEKDFKNNKQLKKFLQK